MHSIKLYTIKDLYAGGRKEKRRRNEKKKKKKEETKKWKRNPKKNTHKSNENTKYTLKLYEWLEKPTKIPNILTNTHKMRSRVWIWMSNVNNKCESATLSYDVTANTRKIEWSRWKPIRVCVLHASLQYLRSPCLAQHWWKILCPSAQFEFNCLIDFEIHWLHAFWFVTILVKYLMALASNSSDSDRFSYAHQFLSSVPAFIIGNH